FDIIDGSAEDFNTHSDAAFVGRRLAARRNLKPGSRFKVGNVDVRVSGIFTSDLPGEDNLAYTRLEFLQRAPGVDSLGRVTQFEVALKSADDAPVVARQIDDLFRADELPTDTKSHKAHIAAATGDLLNLIKFTRYLGLLCVLVVL